MEPDGADYYIQLAALTQESDPMASTQALQHALALNPQDSKAWVELGLRLEQAGDLAGAERNLWTAARIDKLYLPRWSLTNYYFRRSNMDKFWLWAREAAHMAYGDSTPLFSLCWRATDDGELIAHKLDICTAELQASYLNYLTGQNRIVPMSRAAERLLAWNRDVDVPVLLAACDRLIAADRASAALAVWNGLSERHRIPYTIVRPETGHSLTAGDFHALPMSRGFDWRLPGPDGVTTLFEEHPRGMHFTFSGRQPESCEILTQYVPVLEDSSYELRYRYRTADIAPGTGLEWRITNLKGTAVLAHGASLASESETIGQVRFKNPAGSPLVYLSLLYQRASGTIRIEGSITLRQVELIPAREQQPTILPPR